MLATITKNNQVQAPSGIKSYVIRTYATYLRIPTAIGRMRLKDYGERYYGCTIKIITRRVCQNDFLPISLFGAATPAMQLQWTSPSLTVRRHRLGCSEKRVLLIISSCMTYIIRSNTLSIPPGRIQLTRRRRRTKLENALALPVTLLESMPTMS